MSSSSFAGRPPPHNPRFAPTSSPAEREKANAGVSQPAGAARQGSVLDARHRVESINAQAKDRLGHWGRCAGKYLNWTVLGAPLGALAMKKAGQRISATMQNELTELQNIAQRLKEIPKSQRSPAQKALLKQTETALRKFQPTLRTHAMEAIKGPTIASVNAVVVGLTIGLALLNGDASALDGLGDVWYASDVAPFGTFGLPNTSSSLTVKPLRGDDEDLSPS